MFKLQAYLLFCLLILCGSSVDSQDSQITNLPQSQCDQICFAGNSEIQTKLKAIEGDQKNILNILDDQQTEKQIRLDAELLQRELDLLNEPPKQVITQEVFEAALKIKTEEMQSKMDRDLLALEKRFESQLQTLRTQLEDKKDKLQALEVKIESQQARFSEQIPINSLKMIPQEFEMIGTNYYYIEKRIKEDRPTAAENCGQRGGYLTKLPTYRDRIAIEKKLNNTYEYWIDHNKLDEKTGLLESVHECPYFKSGYSFKTSCTNKKFFICQWQ